ncbi:MAG: N-(5'-phosphoribosyl)anthranilate isomerase, partial [Kiritimatiellia bacterium]
MFPFLKICGITRREDALFCAEAGAGALGAVFYPRSPRNVTAEQARDIFADLPADIARVGIFVNRATDEIILVARTATLTTVQLHGEESTA